ncbi:MAG: winged helix-turn-helix transcriptional regulator [Thermodesulfobacteriota bacterium]
MPETVPTISLEILNLIAGIDEFKGRWESLGQLVPNRLQALQRVANMESVAAASRMQGTRCSDRQIGEFLNDRNPQNRLSPAEQDIITNFHIVLKLVNESYEQVSFIDNHIHQMHSLLINKDKPSADQDPELPKKLTSLIEQVNQRVKDGHLHPILIFSDFSCRLWHMRPFQQGNNRLTWLLTQLLLLRHGYRFLAYGSMMRFLEKSLANYQKTLLFSKDGEIVNPAPQAWLDMFLNAMTELQKNIVAKIHHEKELLRLTAPHLEIIRTVQENGQATISQIMTTTNMNRNTLKVRLRKLVAEKYLIQRGRGKATYYLLPELYLQ